MAKFVQVWVKLQTEDVYLLKAINTDCIVTISPAYEVSDIKSIIIVKYNSLEDQVYFCSDSFESLLARI